jgi:hypothetical protein
VPVRDRTGVATHDHEPGQTLGLEREQRVLDLAVVERHHRVAAGRLVAREPQLVERQGVGIGFGHLLLDETTENPTLGDRQLHGASLGPSAQRCRDPSPRSASPAGVLGPEKPAA